MRVAIRILTLSCFVAFWGLPHGAQAQTRRVEAVVDGDRLVLDDGARVQLAGVDAPEREASPKQEADALAAGHDLGQEQRLGDIAAAYLAALVRGKPVRVEPAGVGEDADVFVPHIVLVTTAQGTPLFEVNARMLADGYARLDLEHTVPALGDYVALYQEARRKGLGLWAPASGAPAAAGPVLAPAPASERPPAANAPGDSGEIDPLSSCGTNPACVWVSADTSGVGGMWQSRNGQSCPCTPRQ